MIPFLLTCFLHPVHSTQAEVQWNPQSNRLEVSLKLQHIDVHRVAAREVNGRVQGKLSEEESLQLLQEYLSKHFRLECKQDVGKFHWVGSETEGASMWVYFELSPPKAQPWRLRNTLLLEFESDQTNVVSFLGEKRTSTLFNRERMVQDFVPALSTPSPATRK